MIRQIIIVALFGFGFLTTGNAQQIGVQTNLFYGISTVTPNLGVELRLNKKSTFHLAGSYNPWNLNEKHNNNKKLVHWLTSIEYRRWLCESFNGHFLGLQLIGGEYNISGHDVLGLFDKDSRYEGWGVSTGINYGYHWMWSKRWGMELTFGFGYARLNYDQYDCPTCAEKEGNYSKNYFGLTQAGINLIFLIK